jgi:tetratricopeptide (TPR) repeat protein
MTDSLSQKLTTSYKTALSLMMEKRFNEAALEWTECIRISTIINGDDHQTTIICTRNVGDCLTRAGRVEEALGYLRHAHQFFEARADAYKEALAITSKSLALCLVAARDFSTAVPYLEAAIDQNIACFGTCCGSVLRLQSVLADCLVALGQTRAVAKLGEKVLREAIASGLPQDKFLVKILQHLTRAYYRLQNSKRGLAISLRSAALARRVEGHRSLNMLEEMRFTSRFLWWLHRRDDAVSTLEKVLKIIHKQHRKNEDYRLEVVAELEQRRKAIAKSARLNAAKLQSDDVLF